MVALSVLLAIVLGVAALVALSLLASAVTFGLFAIAPHLQNSWLGVEITIRKWRLPDRVWRDEQPFAVSICLHPLTNPPSYLVGLVRDGSAHRIAFSGDKKDARVINDPMCMKAWLWTLQERHGYDPFVVVPPKGRN
ncbi:MAG TPA: hypothetical protein VJN92_15655 [Candidatus Acidoferrum sp.]|nr:hypothetical protein [Candidatus Acidoferrum sp.]